MSKKTLIYCMVAAASVLSFLQLNVSKQEQSELTKANIEALSLNLNEWWNRNDYVCSPVICECIFYHYSSDVADMVEKGKGSVAHTWDCAGCADGCGWISA